MSLDEVDVQSEPLGLTQQHRTPARPCEVVCRNPDVSLTCVHAVKNRKLPSDHSGTLDVFAQALRELPKSRLNHVWKVGQTLTFSSDTLPPTHWDFLQLQPLEVSHRLAHDVYCYRLR